MAKTKRIDVLLVDEATHEISSFLAVLATRGLRVVTCDSAKSCLAMLRAGTRSRLYVLDVMLMSDGAYDTRETAGDLFTGVRLAYDVRKLDHAAPILFFTNAALEPVKSALANARDKLGNVGIVHKFQVDPAQFTRVVEEALARKSATQSASFLEAASDAVIAQPTFFGFGFDVKAFLRKVFRKRSASP